jgi:predicted transcriptional regulator of viral defense system
MKFIDFKKRIMDFPVFSSRHLTGMGGNTQVLRNQLTEWCRKGLVIRLRKGLYVLNDTDRRITPSRLFLANQLYIPSYVSTEYALHFYDLIPERVADITSVSSKKPVTFENYFGRFIYQHIKLKAFTGYRMLKDENNFNVLIAEPEKALLDYLYLNLSDFSTTDMVIESVRLQHLDSLNQKKLMKFARLFDRDKLMKMTKQLASYIRKR